MKFEFTLIVGLLLQITCSAQNDTRTNDSVKVFTFVEEMPEYPGGQNELYKFIGENTVYPKAQRDAGIQGKVYVQFVVNEDGKVSNAEVKRGANPALDAEALRVVNLFPDFKPGKQQGKVVKVFYLIPFSFKLTDPTPVNSTKGENETKGKKKKK